jgi:V/A-type H+-transporting ATPase subunit D
MEQVSATRSELLARRARIRLAAQGRDLLKERRSALVHEFNRLGASALASMDALDRDAATPAASSACRWPRKAWSRWNRPLTPPTARSS